MFTDTSLSLLAKVNMNIKLMLTCINKYIPILIAKETVLLWERLPSFGRDELAQLLPISMLNDTPQHCKSSCSADVLSVNSLWFFVHWSFVVTAMELAEFWLFTHLLQILFSPPAFWIEELHRISLGLVLQLLLCGNLNIPVFWFTRFYNMTSWHIR